MQGFPRYVYGFVDRGLGASRIFVGPVLLLTAKTGLT